jgi:hypothetical protein
LASFSRYVVDSPASCTAEEDEKESAQAENFSIGADRFLIAFNAATGASVANEWRWQLAVMNVDHGQIIR